MSKIDLTKWAIGSEDAARIGGTTTHTLKNWRAKNRLFEEKSRGRGVPVSFYLGDVLKIAVITRMIGLGVPTELACRQAQGSNHLTKLATDEPVMLGWRDGKFIRAFDLNSDPHLCIPLDGIASEIVDKLADRVAFEHGKSAAEEAKDSFWRRVTTARSEYARQSIENPIAPGTEGTINQGQTHDPAKTGGGQGKDKDDV